MKINDPTPKSFLEHLEDLRWVIIRSAAVFAVFAVLGMVFTPQVLDFLYEPLRRAGHDPAEMLRVLGVLDPLSIQIDLALMGGFLLSLPFILFFLAQFLLPALTPREARALFPAFAAGTLLFVGGAAFCYYLMLPGTLKVFFQLSAWQGLRVDWTAQSYIEFVLQMLLAFGISFELPLVLVILNILGIVRAATLRRYRRHTFFGIVVAACFVVPATDPFSLGMLIVPMYLLFEGTILVASFLERRRDGGGIDAYPESPA